MEEGRPDFATSGDIVLVGADFTQEAFEPAQSQLSKDGASRRIEFSPSTGDIVRFGLGTMPLRNSLDLY